MARGLSPGETQRRVQAHRKKEQEVIHEFVDVDLLLKMPVDERALLLPHLRRPGDVIMSIDTLPGGDMTPGNREKTFRCSHAMSKLLRRGWKGQTFRLDAFVRVADFLSAARSPLADQWQDDYLAADVYRAVRYNENRRFQIMMREAEGGEAEAYYVRSLQGHSLPALYPHMYAWTVGSEGAPAKVYHCTEKRHVQSILDRASSVVAGTSTTAPWCTCAPCGRQPRPTGAQGASGVTWSSRCVAP
jgi:hypothetical protein